MIDAFNFSSDCVTDVSCSYHPAPVYNTSSVAKPTAPVYETTVVPTYTTYCPQPTKVTYGTKIWTVTEATTLTLTSVTVTMPVYSSVVTVSSEWYLISVSVP